MSRHIVLTRCSESVEQLHWLRQFKNKDTTVTIYNKGDWSNFDLPNDILDFTNVLTRVNTGRDGEGQVWHIYNNYNNLPDELIFLQPRFDDHIDWPYWSGREAKPTADKLPDSIVNHDYDGSELQMFSNDTVECWNVSDELVHNFQTGLDDCDFIHINKLLNTNYKRADKFCLRFGAGMMYSIPKSLLINKSKRWWNQCYRFYMSYPGPDHHCYVFERFYLEMFYYNESTNTISNYRKTLRE